MDNERRVRPGDKKMKADVPQKTPSNRAKRSVTNRDEASAPEGEGASHSVNRKGTDHMLQSASPRAKEDAVNQELLSAQNDEISPVLSTGAAEISVPLSGESIYAFKTYAMLLKEWNDRMNLTGIMDDHGIALRHFVDSLTLVPFLNEEMAKKGKKTLTLVDVGTGAGFPGIPLKVAMPEIEVLLLDSLKKRIHFLEEVCTALSLKKMTCFHSRAEDAGRSKLHRERFDVATARAVAALPILCELCLPFVKVGGIFLAMKGHVEDEIEMSQKAVVTMGGTIESVHQFVLPGTDMKRAVVVIRKLRPTPPKYPRTAGKPEKDPIL